MAGTRKCKKCGQEFDLRYTKSVIGKRYGKGVYDAAYDNDVCFDCADREIGEGYAEGEDLMDLMDGHDWG